MNSGTDHGPLTRHKRDRPWCNLRRVYGWASLAVGREREEVGGCALVVIVIVIVIVINVSQESFVQLGALLSRAQCACLIRPDSFD
jgi:hypothetical protein